MPYRLRAAVLFAAILLAPIAIGALTPSTLAQTAPADSAIKGALYDIGRAEQQVKTLTPSRKANIKRLQRSMEMAAKRLESSPNKTHASWTEAKQRLDKVNGALATLAGGGAAKPPAAAATPKAAPKSSAPAATTQTAPQTAPKSAAPKAAAADPQVLRAQREMKLVEAQVRNLRPADGSGAFRQLKELYRIGGYLAKTKDRSHPAFQQAAQQYNAIKGKLVGNIVAIEQKRLMKVAGEIDKMRPLDYSNKQKVDYGRKSLANIQNSLKSLGAPKVPAVQNLYGRTAKVSQLFEKRVADRNAQQASLGDVSGKLAALKKRFHTIKVPGRIEHPATEAKVNSFVASVAAVRAHVKEDLAYIKSIDGKAALSTQDGNTFRYLRSALQGEKPRALAQALTTVNMEMDLNTDQVMSTVDFLDKTDPEDVNHRNNRLTGKGQYKENLDNLAKARKAVMVAALYDEKMGRTDAPDRKAQLAKVDKVTADFKEKYKIALGSVRMPEARSDDEKLHKAVAEVFARKKYGYKYERVVINAPLKRIKNRSGNIRGTVSGATVTTYEYVWDQFQATTAEKVGDVYYLYANTFKYYHSGGPQTPVKVWILNRRFQSSQILKENIDK